MNRKPVTLCIGALSAFLWSPIVQAAPSVALESKRLSLQRELMAAQATFKNATKASNAAIEAITQLCMQHPHLCAEDPSTPERRRQSIKSALGSNECTTIAAIDCISDSTRRSRTEVLRNLVKKVSEAEEARSEARVATEAENRPEETAEATADDGPLGQLKQALKKTCSKAESSSDLITCANAALGQTDDEQRETLCVELSEYVCTNPPGSYEADPAARDQLYKALLADEDASKRLQEAESAFVRAETGAMDFEKNVLRAFSDDTRATFADAMRGVLTVRCITAFCFGGPDGTRYAIEPVLDLPISMYWALGGGGLARHVNGGRFQIKINAGVRFWLADDKVSFGLLLAEPTLTQSEEFGLDGSNRVFTNNSISRPFPTVIVGLFADVIGFSFSVDQVRNGDGKGDPDPTFRSNAVLSRALTIGVSINTFTALRNAFGVRNKDGN